MVVDTNKIIIDSRLSPKFNCNRSIMDDYNMQCSNADKWLIAIIIGMIFFILSNSITMYCLHVIISKINGKPYQTIDVYPSLVYSLIMTVIFIIVIKLILW
jgi:hypothetical protein